MKFLAIEKISRLDVFVTLLIVLLLYIVSFLKMNTSIFHASGAVLIDLSHVDNVEQIYRQLIDRTRQTAVDSDADRNQNEMLTQESAVERVPAPFQEEAEEVGFDGFGDCGGDAESPEKKEMPVEEKVDRMVNLCLAGSALMS